MMQINLHVIFRYLVDDDTFLSTVVETDQNEFEESRKKKNEFSLMTDMMIDYSPLVAYETQEYNLFPQKIKNFLSPDYVRFGIKNVIEKKAKTINTTFINVNISFLSSLNILLRPALHKMNIDEHISNVHLLEAYIDHKIHRNYQIDKIKNTKKVKVVNAELSKNLFEGKLSHELIQAIINIFEINLLVFDLTKLEVQLYWTKGYKYPYLNLFKDIHCMSFVQGNYEPIFTMEKNIPKEVIQKIYIQILANIGEIKAYPEVNLFSTSLEVINSWNIDKESYVKILGNFFNKSKSDFNERIKELHKFGIK